MGAAFCRRSEIEVEIVDASEVQIVEQESALAHLGYSASVDVIVAMSPTHQAESELMENHIEQGALSDDMQELRAAAACEAHTLVQLAESREEQRLSSDELNDARASEAYAESKVAEMLTEHEALSAELQEHIVFTTSEARAESQLAERLSSELHEEMLSTQRAEARASQVREESYTPSLSSCAVCFEFAASYAVNPCGHQCLCGGCMTAMTASEGPNARCPICRGPVQSFLKIFIAQRCMQEEISQMQEDLQNALGEQEEILEEAVAAEVRASHLSAMNDELNAARQTAANAARRMAAATPFGIPPPLLASACGAAERFEPSFRRGRVESLPPRLPALPGSTGLRSQSQAMTQRRRPCERLATLNAESPECLGRSMSTGSLVFLTRTEREQLDGQ